MDLNSTATSRSKKEKTKTLEDFQTSKCQPCIIQLPPGPQGKSGTSMMSGMGVPLNGYGNNGDTYVELPGGRVYRNIDGQWIPTSENLKGDKGDPGPPLSGAFGRMYIDYTQNTKCDIGTTWTPIGSTNWVIDYSSFNVSLTQNNNGFSMLRVNVSGVYEVEFNSSFNTTSKLWYRLTSTTNGPINGTYGMDEAGNKGTLRVGTNTQIWASAGTSFYVEGYTEEASTWYVNNASLRIKMLYPSNTPSIQV